MFAVGGLGGVGRGIGAVHGQTTVQVSGMLQPYEMHSYIIAIGPGQRLELRLDGFAGRDVVMRVLDLKSGHPFDEKAGTGTRVWAAKIMQGGDVRVDVRRRSPEVKTMPLYVLAAGVR